MSGETKITVQGYLSADPQLRFTPKDTPAARILIVTPRREWDRKGCRWGPGEPQLTFGTALGQLALDMCEVLREATPVTAIGYLTRTEDGYVELALKDVAISLRNGVTPAKALPVEPSYDVRKLTPIKPGTQVPPPTKPPTKPVLPPRPTRPPSQPEVPPKPNHPPFPVHRAARATNPNWLFDICRRMRERAAIRFKSR